jgi:hypothetical protein
MNNLLLYRSTPQTRSAIARQHAIRECGAPTAHTIRRETQRRRGADREIAADGRDFLFNASGSNLITRKAVDRNMSIDDDGNDEMCGDENDSGDRDIPDHSHVKASKVNTCEIVVQNLKATLQVL